MPCVHQRDFGIDVYEEFMSSERACRTNARQTGESNGERWRAATKEQSGPLSAVKVGFFFFREIDSWSCLGTSAPGLGQGNTVLSSVHSDSTWGHLLYAAGQRLMPDSLPQASHSHFQTPFSLCNSSRSSHHPPSFHYFAL